MNYKDFYSNDLTNWANAFSLKSHLIDSFPVWQSLWFSKVDNWANAFLWCDFVYALINEVIEQIASDRNHSCMAFSIMGSLMDS